jgi:hypothetical protein
MVLAVKQLVTLRLNTKRRQRFTGFSVLSVYSVSK